MPEAWGNANAVDMLRDMLVQERTDSPTTVESRTTLHLLAGLPGDWIWAAKAGEVVSVERTPTTLGTVVSLKLTRATQPGKLQLELDPGARATDVVVHIPTREHEEFSEKVSSVKIGGKEVPASAISTAGPIGARVTEVSLPGLSHPVTLDITLAGMIVTTVSQTKGGKGSR
jgi:hypothetical protein